MTASVLKEAVNLRVIGCFCIGTNQVDLDYASSRGVRKYFKLGDLITVVYIFTIDFTDCSIQLAF